MKVGNYSPGSQPTSLPYPHPPGMSCFPRSSLLSWLCLVQGWAFHRCLVHPCSLAEDKADPRSHLCIGSVWSLLCKAPMEEMRAPWGRRQAPEMKDAVSEGDRAKAETANQAHTCERVGLLCPNKVLVAHLRHSLLSITATCHGVSGKQQCLEVRTGVSCHPGDHFSGTDGKDALDF